MLFLMEAQYLSLIWYSIITVSKKKKRKENHNTFT